MDASDFAALQAIVRRENGMALDPSQQYAIARRLEPLVRARRCANLHGLLVAARGGRDRALDSAIAEALTVNETRFFRDPHVFTTLARTIIPELLARRGSLSVWCAASASGQEPYSLAMMMRDRFAGCRTEIIASDYARAMVERTTAGTYSDFEVSRGLTPDLLARHFVREPKSWSVRPPLRAMVKPMQLNLVAPWPTLPRFDLVLMRNVLVYLGTAERAAVLARARDLLTDNGVLVLGATESCAADGFTRQVVDQLVMFRAQSSAPLEVSR